MESDRYIGDINNNFDLTPSESTDPTMSEGEAEVLLTKKIKKETDAIIPGSGIQEDGTCRHHWLLNTPDGHHTIGGRCKHCNIEREYYASSYDNEAVTARNNKSKKSNDSLF